MRAIEQAARATQANFCAVTALDLAFACCEHAKLQGSPIDTSLALHSFFLGIGNSIDDRPVATVEVDELSSRLTPLLNHLANNGISDTDDSRRAITEKLCRLRDLIR